MSSPRIALGALVALLLVALAACQQNSMPASSSGLDGPAGNGARIYFTGASERGTSVTHTGATNVGGGMMGGFNQWLTCASCHGPQGRGGTHVMHMNPMTAPSIGYAALSAMPEMKGRQRPYDLDDFRKTVEQGFHPDGEEVKVEMPRWQMSEADLADLFTFLKALPD
jgi:hypothetical protein